MEISGTVLLWLRLTVSLLCAVINGIDLSFNVYAVTLKETFNFTQTQVEVTASMSCLGFGLTFLETLMTAIFGYTTTFIVTWIALPLSSGLFALAAVYNNSFHSWPVLVFLIQLLLSTSNGGALIVVERLSVSILPQQYAGTFIGLFGAAICLGKIVFATLFKIFFLGNLSGFFICLAILSAVLLGVCYVLLYPVAIASEREVTEESGEISQDASTKDMFRSRFFHMLFWPSAIFASGGYTILNNITSIADSTGITDSFTIVTIMSICIMTTRVVYGLSFDKHPSDSCGFWLLYSTYSCFSIGLALGFYYLNTVSIYFITIFCGIGLGPAFSLPVAMLVVRFGPSNFGAISVVFYASVAAIELSMQVYVGLLYDREIGERNTVGRSCKGTSCFYGSFVTLFALTLLVAGVQTVNFYLTLRDKKEKTALLKGI